MGSGGSEGFTYLIFSQKTRQTNVTRCGAMQSDQIVLISLIPLEDMAP